MFGGFLFSIILIGSFTASAATDTSWLTNFKGKYSYDFVKDQRTKQFVNQTFLTKKCDGKDLGKSVFDALSGPGEPVEYRANQFATVHACKRHACNAISMVWADIKLGKAASAYVDLAGGPVYIGSRDFAARNIDPDFKTDLDAWLGKINWNGKKPDIVFCGPNEKIEAIVR